MQLQENVNLFLNHFEFFLADLFEKLQWNKCGLSELPWRKSFHLWDFGLFRSSRYCYSKRTFYWFKLWNQLDFVWNEFVLLRFLNKNGSLLSHRIMRLVPAYDAHFWSASIYRRELRSVILSWFIKPFLVKTSFFSRLLNIPLPFRLRSFPLIYSKQDL